LAQQLMQISHHTGDMDFLAIHGFIAAEKRLNVLHPATSIPAGATVIKFQIATQMAIVVMATFKFLTAGKMQ